MQSPFHFRSNWVVILIFERFLVDEPDEFRVELRLPEPESDLDLNKNDIF